MNEQIKIQSLYNKELEKEINCLHTEILKIEGKDFAQKLKIKDKINKERKRKKYKFNQKIFEDDNNFDVKNDAIFISMEYENSSNKQGNDSFLNSLKFNIKKNQSNNYNNKKKEEHTEFEEDEESENEDENRINEIKGNNKGKKKKYYNKSNQKEYNNIFGEERDPPDDDQILEPIFKTIEVSDIEVEEEEENEEAEIINQDINKNKPIVAEKETPVENNLQFTEYILAQVKTPIDMISIGEKVYELFNKNNKSNDNIDLSPLTAYKKDKEIKVQLFKDFNMAGQYNQFLQNSKSSLEDYISIDQKNEVPTAMIIDNRDYKTNCSICIGTNKSTLIKIPICNKPSKDCQGMMIKTEEIGISSIDCFENYLIMGHINGCIQIIEDQKIIDKMKDAKNEIIQIKFLKINTKKKKVEFIYSDSNGIVNYVKRAKTLIMSRNINEQIASCKEFPVYKICLFSKEKDLKIIKKKNILIALASLKNVSLYKIRPKSENQRIASIEIPYCNIGDFVFDCDFGYGFPPIPELQTLKEKEKNGQISLIENALIEEGKKESILFVVSYGKVLRLFEIKLEANYYIDIDEIGYYITEFSVYRLGFITKSYLVIIDSRNQLQIINTFCFENKIFKELTDQTNNNIITYEQIDLSKLYILKQNNIFFNSKDDKRCAGNTNYLGSVLIFEQNIFIVSKQKFLLYKLFRWDEVLKNLCQDEEYKKMIWLSTFILGKNKSLFEIESEDNIEKEYDHSLQESIYIFLLKGTSEENNYKEIRMLIEYCLKTGRFKDFYKAKDALAMRKLENYLYEYTTDYISNGKFSKIELESDFLEEYINYYLQKNERILLSKLLLKLNANSLNKPKIIKILEDNSIINPYIYAKMKEKEGTKNDYFKPIQCLFTLFKRKIKDIQEDGEDIIKKEYLELITKHDMKYYYEKTLSCNDYLGHRLLWYINKCLSNEEFNKENCLPNDAFELTCKKIFLFLISSKTMESLLQFDSFSYFSLLTKLFTDFKINRIMDFDIDKHKFPYAGLESFAQLYLGNISIEYLSEKYFYYEIKSFVDEKIEQFKNSVYIKFDFFQMTAYMCQKRKNNFFDRMTIINAIKYLINYELLFEGEKSKDYYDPFNCHIIPDKDNKLYKDFSDNIENCILYLLESLQKYQDLYENDLDQLFDLEGLKNHCKIKTYLNECARNYEDVYYIKLEEYKKHNPLLTKEENLKNFFDWIIKALNVSKKMKNTDYYQKFKQFIKSKLLELSKFSIEYSFDIISQFFDEKEEEEICFTIESDELKYAYLDKYLLAHDQQDEIDKKYEKYLRMKIDILIRNEHKEQILNIIEKNRILWIDDILNLLIKNEVYDAAIFISQKHDNIDNCMKLSVTQMEKNFNDIKQLLLEYSENVGSEIFYIKLEEIKKYLDLALISCASWTEINSNYNTDDVNSTWLISLDLFYKFKNELSKDNKDHKFTLRNKSNTFDSIYDNINRNILENIEYILSKMNDYIPLSFIVKLLCKKFQNAKFKDYSKMFQRMFYSTRRTEEIFKSITNLSFNSLSNEYKVLLKEAKTASFFDLSECNYCNESIYDITESYEIICFKCGHLYHNFCCSIEKGKYACYICRMKDMEDSTYTDIPKLVLRAKDNLKKREKDEKTIKKEERKKRSLLKNKLDKLKKISKKRYENLENFKANIDNTQIN